MRDNRRSRVTCDPPEAVLTADRPSFAVSVPCANRSAVPHASNANEPPSLRDRQRARLNAPRILVLTGPRESWS